MNPEFDALIERYLTSIPRADRAAAAIVHHMTDQVVVLDQFYDATATAVVNRLANLAPRVARGGTNTWNVPRVGRPVISAASNTSLYPSLFDGTTMAG